MARMGVDNLKSNLSNVARVYLWEVLFPNIIGGGADTETLLLRAQSTNLPARDTGSIVVPYKQTGGVAYPGKVSFGDHQWEVTFIEGEDKAVFEAFYKWVEKVVSARDGVGNPVPEVKVDVQLNLLNTKGEQFLGIRLIGCWIKTIGRTELSYERDEPLRFTVTLVYDWWEEVS